MTLPAAVSELLSETLPFPLHHCIMWACLDLFFHSFLRGFPFFGIPSCCNTVTQHCERTEQGGLFPVVLLAESFLWVAYMHHRMIATSVNSICVIFHHLGQSGCPGCQNFNVLWGCRQVNRSLYSNLLSQTSHIKLWLCNKYQVRKANRNRLKWFHCSRLRSGYTVSELSSNAQD